MRVSKLWIIYLWYLSCD